MATTLIEGTYQNTGQENMDQYCAVLEIPYLARKMILANRPTMDIRRNKNGTWTIRVASFIHKVQITFQLGIEYDDVCFDNNLNSIKSVTVLRDDNVLETKSYDFYDVVITKTYEFTNNECILTMQHKESGVTARRYFTKIK